MKLLLHLSDIHLCANGAPAPSLLESLYAAIAKVAADARDGVAVAVTGDIVDSGDTDETMAADAVRGLVKGIREAIDGPIVLMPGNHDRRSSGASAPWSSHLMNEIRASVDDIDDVLCVAADAQEPLASRIEVLSKLFDAEVVAYDTTHTLMGTFSSGGMLRVEDFLAVDGIVGSTRPVIVLLHHHLIPTPVADASVIGTDKVGLFKRFFVKSVLPRIVTFGDREEIFMTALRAGTALTLLHALGSPVLALHGHKHYPTARVLRAVTEADGDVIVASAGSAGVLEPYRSANEKDVIWPSFNALRFEDKRIDIETVYFPPTHAPDTDIVRQALLSVERQHTRWLVTPVPPPPPASTDVESDTATFTLFAGGAGYSTFECVREVTSAAGFDAYRERVEAAPRADFEGVVVEKGKTYLEIRPNERIGYRAINGLCRDVATAARDYRGDEFSPFEWVWLDVRKGTKRARLELRGLAEDARAFATVMDLHTGQERPAKVERNADSVVLEVAPCPARRLLRIYFPLTRQP